MLYDDVLCMDLEKWGQEDYKKCLEHVATCADKLDKGKKIDIFEDLIPQYKALKGKSNTNLLCAGSIEGVEQFPSCNLGLLLGSGLYDHVIVPLRCLSDKTRFERVYGLVEDRGCHLNFDQFLSLIEDGKIKVVLERDASNYKAGFYERIFNSCEELPSFAGIKIHLLMSSLKLVQVAHSEKIKINGDWSQKVKNLHPEYTLDGCINEIRQLLGKEFLEQTAIEQDRPNWEVAAEYIGSRLLRLRQMGFERLAEIALRCTRKDKHFGYWALSNYDHYLTNPLFGKLLSFNNYNIADMRRMSILKLLPEKLKGIWNEILSSSPASSSVVSPQTSLESVELKGMELLTLIDGFADDVNARILRRNIVDVNESLSKFDISSAERSISRIDEIITESINSEIRSYKTKGRVFGHLLRLGKTFTTMASAGLTMFSGVMAGIGKFDWVAAMLVGTGASAWIHERLDEIKAEDILRWWSRTWPFEDPGIGFVMWEKQTEA